MTRTVHPPATAWRAPTLDLTRLRSRTLLGLGPLDMPTADDLADHLIALGGLSEWNRIGTVTGADGQWRRDLESVRDAVVDWSSFGPGGDTLSLVDKVNWLSDETASGDRVRIFRSPRDVILDVPHEIIDGQGVAQMWATLAGAPLDDDWAASTTPAVSAASLLAGHLLRHPGAIAPLALDAVRARRQPPPVLTPSPSTGRRRGSTVCLDRTRLAELNRWRTTAGGGASLAATVMTGVTSAYASHQIAIDPVAVVVADGRRYGGPDLAGYYGNFSIGMNLPISKYPRAADLAAAIRRSIACGRPLAAMTAAGIGHRLARGTIDDAPAAALQATTSRLSFSYVPVRPELVDGRWIGGFENRQTVCVADQIGPTGIATLFAKYPDAMDIAATFDPDVHPEPLIGAALAAFAAEPIEYLEKGGRR
ncbi:MAG: hypothetical protein QM658_01465 [Gordonia sp. (in: high G+C Gram-positive bacteria)]